MPVDPENPYVDQPHPATIGRASEGWRYGCYNREDPPGDMSVEIVQTGWTPDGRRTVRGVVSKWLPGGCRHSEKTTDPACAGCRQVTARGKTEEAVAIHGAAMPARTPPED